MRRLRGARGLTLLELVVAIAVLSIGTLAALRATDQSRRALAGSEARLLAELAAQNRAEELRLLGAGAALPGAVTLGRHRFALTTRRRSTEAGLVEARITARAETGEGAVLVAILPAAGP